MFYQAEKFPSSYASYKYTAQIAESLSIQNEDFKPFHWNVMHEKIGIFVENNQICFGDVTHDLQGASRAGITVSRFFRVCRTEFL